MRLLAIIRGARRAAVLRAAAGLLSIGFTGAALALPMQPMPLQAPDSFAATAHPPGDWARRAGDFHKGSLLGAGDSGSFSAGLADGRENPQHPVPAFDGGHEHPRLGGGDGGGWDHEHCERCGGAIGAVPEPGSYALMLAGMLAVGVLQLRRRATRQRRASSRADGGLGDPA